MIGIGRLTRFAAGTIAVACFATSATASAAEIYKMSTLAPGTSAYVVASAFVREVERHAPGIDIRLSSTGSGVRQSLDMAEGKTDFALFGGITYYLMTGRRGPFHSIRNAPKLVKNVRNLFSFPLGAYTMVTYADSGIKSLKDIKGKKVFFGPPQGSATIAAEAMVEAATGYTPGKDFRVLPVGFAAAQQAFQDHNLDVWISPQNNPSAAIRQIALTSKIRILSLTNADLQTPVLKKLLAVPGREIFVIKPGTYGKNQVNTEPAKTIGTWISFGCRKAIPTDVVYRMMKAFWGHIADVQSEAPWLKQVTLESAFKAMEGPLHPGAVKYYREIGVKIPPRLLPRD